MRRAIKPATILLAGLLVLDALFALLGWPSLVSGESIDESGSAQIALAALAIGNILLIARPRPGPIIFNCAVIAGTIAWAVRGDLGLFVWIAISGLITIAAGFMYAFELREMRVEAIHARIEEEIIDGSLLRDDLSTTSVH